MKKFLPAILLGMVFCIAFLITPVVFGQTAPSVPEGTWVRDGDVTFAGKLVARSKEFLHSVLQNYEWYFLQSTTSSSSLALFWVTVRNIVYAFFAIFVLVTAFIIIINRGRNITLFKFIPRFIAIVLLVTFSFALIQFIYQITDIIQGFFFQLLYDENGKVNVSKVINISYNYQNFVGYRLFGPQYDESTFIALLLTKLTAVTMYVMAGVLFVRKIILWFFIIISPIFPLLLLYSPIRNTGKIWFGEFLKWLLYGPLFAVFLAGVASLWGSQIFRLSASSAPPSYPTATNILLGGPGQQVSIANSVNTPETFVLYIISLIMLWATIILPFVLLQIFLSYFQNLSGDAGLVRQMLNVTSTFLKPNSPPPPLPPATTGMAKSLPMPAKAGVAREIERPLSQSSQVVRNSSINSAVNRPVTISNTFNQPVTTTNQQFNQVTNSILQTANLRIPTITDIARFDTHSVTNSEESKKESSRVASVLNTISNPRVAETVTQRDQFRVVRDQLIQEKQKGNPVASAVLQAATTVSESVNGAQVPTQLPAVNRVQNVSLEDYEAVKKMWQENYSKIEAPKNMDGTQRDKSVWIQEDTQKVQEAINKLGSHDPKIVKEGMNMVSSLLPFLLVGGFSQTEILAYLKAKLEAGKTVLSDMNKKQDEESTMLDRQIGKKEQAAMTMSAEAPLEEKPEIVQTDNKPV